MFLGKLSVFLSLHPSKSSLAGSLANFWSRDKGSIGDIEGKTEKSMTGIKPVTDFSV